LARAANFLSYNRARSLDSCSTVDHAQRQPLFSLPHTHLPQLYFAHLQRRLPPVAHYTPPSWHNRKLFRDTPL